MQEDPRRAAAAGLHVLSPGAPVRWKAASRSRCAPWAGSRPARSRAPSCPPEPTVAQRLVRAKKKDREAGIPYRVPPRRPARGAALRACWRCSYLVFNEGYSVDSGDDLVRVDLCDEAMGLLHAWSTSCCRVRPKCVDCSLLMLLQHSRRATRTDAVGRPRAARGPGPRAMDLRDDRRGASRCSTTHSLSGPRPGPYQLQAAIAALHAQCAPARRHRLAADREPSTCALASSHAEPRGRAEPCRGGGDGRRAWRRTAPGRGARRRPRPLPPVPRHPRRPAPSPRAVARKPGSPPCERWRSSIEPGRARLLEGAARMSSV